MARVQLPESKLKARRRKHKIVIASVFALLAILAVGAIAGIAHLPHWRIVSVQAEGVEGTEVQILTSNIKEKLEGNYFLLFPRNNVLLYPRSAIRAELLKEFPMYSTIDIEADKLRTLLVRVEKRTPKAVWCGTARNEEEACLHLDASGVAYEPAAEFQGAVYTIYYGRLAEGSLPRQYLTEADYRSLSALAAEIETSQGVQILSIEADTLGDARLRFVNGFELIVAVKDGGGDIMERFNLALQAKVFQEHALGEFAYLDLRFGDRLYYKLKGE